MESPQNVGTNSPEDWILVVDDEAPIREVMIGFLRETGVSVVEAEDAAAALAIVAQQPTEPLIAFVDVVMSGMDGLTLSRKLRGLLRSTQIILMSGQTSRQAWWPADVLELAFLAKPFRYSEVVAMVTAARRVRG